MSNSFSIVLDVGRDVIPGVISGKELGVKNGSVSSKELITPDLAFDISGNVDIVVDCLVEGKVSESVASLGSVPSKDSVLIKSVVTSTDGK